MLQVEKVHFSSGTVRLALGIPWHLLASLGHLGYLGYLGYLGSRARISQRPLRGEDLSVRRFKRTPPGQCSPGSSAFEIGSGANMHAT